MSEDAFVYTAIVLWGVFGGGGVLWIGIGMIRDHRAVVRRHHERMAEMKEWHD